MLTIKGVLRTRFDRHLRMACRAAAFREKWG